MAWLQILQVEIQQFPGQGGSNLKCFRIWLVMQLLASLLGDIWETLKPQIVLLCLEACGNFDRDLSIVRAVLTHLDDPRVYA